MAGPGDLLAATAGLVAIPSVSHDEAVIAATVEKALAAPCPLAEGRAVGENVVARTDRGRTQRLVLAGHLDTVPPNDNAQARLEGDTLWGVGSSDMKGGLAVMLDLATTVAEPEVDVTWCFYACEEVGRAESGLLQLWNERPDLLAGDAAILGEPTCALVEAGCQGTLQVRITLKGVRAHTARPFTGRNAIHRLGALIDAVAAWGGREVVLDGCTYAEQLQAVAIEGGVASNVVPDRATLVLNHRYAPDRQAAEAEAFVRQLLDAFLEPADEWELVDAGDGAPPSLGHPAARRPRGEEWRLLPKPRSAGPTSPRSWEHGGSGGQLPAQVTRCWPTTPKSPGGDPGPAGAGSPGAGRAHHLTVTCITHVSP